MQFFLSPVNAFTTYHILLVNRDIFMQVYLVILLRTMGIFDSQVWLKLVVWKEPRKVWDTHTSIKIFGVQKFVEKVGKFVIQEGVEGAISLVA